MVRLESFSRMTPNNLNTTRPVEGHLELTILRMQGKQFQITLSREGHPCGHHTCSTQSYQSVHALVDGFRQLLKSGGNTTLSAPLLHSVGIELFHLWVAPFWCEVEKTISRRYPTFLTVVANTPEVLNLPWELLKWPDGLVLGLDTRFILRRRPHHVEAPERSGTATVPPGKVLTSKPLKILLMASTPSDFDNTGAEAKVEPLLHEIAGHSNHLAVSSAYPPTRAALTQALQQQQPHIVYLTGPLLIRGEQGFFGFEDEEGLADILSAKEIVQIFFKKRTVPMIIISGRALASPPPVASASALCQTLTLQAVPLALAWPSTPTDPFFRAFLHAFLQNAADGVAVDDAIRKARQAIQPDCERTGYPAWVLPMLYARSHAFPAATGSSAPQS